MTRDNEPSTGLSEREAVQASCGELSEATEAEQGGADA